MLEGMASRFSGVDRSSSIQIRDAYVMQTNLCTGLSLHDGGLADESRAVEPRADRSNPLSIDPHSAR